MYHAFECPSVLPLNAVLLMAPVAAMQSTALLPNWPGQRWLPPRDGRVAAVRHGFNRAQQHEARPQRQRRQRADTAKAAAAAADAPQAAQPAAAEASAAAAAAVAQRLAAAQAVHMQGSKEVEVDVVGTAQHLGVEMEWRLSFSSNGSFLEELHSPQMSCTCGYASPGEEAAAAATASSTVGSSSGSEREASSSSSSSSSSSYFSAQGVCWGSDDGGCPRQLQLDDEEALLLCMWVRTGLWLLPSVAAQLDIAAAPWPLPTKRQRGESDDSDSDGEVESRRFDGSTAWLELRLRGGGQVACLVEVCPATWRPLSMRLQLAGEHELWSFSDWQEWQPGMWLAGGAEQTTSGDGSLLNSYQPQSMQLQPSSGITAAAAPAAAAEPGAAEAARSSSAAGGSRFAQPPTPLLPEDASFLEGVPNEVTAWHTSSGHSLVRPLLNGKQVGYFIFDTGASGFVLDPQAGDALGLEAFGELQVTSMVGRIGSRFRRAESFQLGPLRMLRPLFMELPCSGLVSGVPDGGRVVGIVGYDVLRRATVHMPPPPRRLPTPSAVVSAPVDSPAAAVAVSVSAAQLRRAAQQYTLQLLNPATGDRGGMPAPAAVAEPSTSSSAAVPGLASSSTATAAAAVGSIAAASSSTIALPYSSSSGSGITATVAPSQLPDPPPVQASQLPSLVPPQSSQAPARSSSSTTAAAAAAVEEAETLEWLPLVMVSSLPHVELELVTASGRRHRGLFMMDSGAGGLDLILNARVATGMRLSEEAAGGGATQIKGIGSEAGSSISARRCQLAEVHMGSHSFQAVQALYHQSSGGSSGGLELSQHTSGIVCGGLLSRCALTFDYARMRVGVRRV